MELRLLFWAYNIIFYFANLHDEIIFHTEFFKCNSYPGTLLNSHIQKFLSAQYTAASVSDVAIEKQNYFSFPYPFFAVNLSRLGTNYYSTKQLKIVLFNCSTVGRMSYFKGKLRAGMRSSLVQELSCAHCPSKHVGSTMRALCSRAAKHTGSNSRTGNILVIIVYF